MPESSMPATRLMKGHTGLYHVEAHVPVELSRIIGRLRVVKSLSTRDHAEAVERAPAVAEQIVEAIENLRNEVRAMRPRKTPAKTLDVLMNGTDVEPLPASAGIDRAMENLFVLNCETTLGLADADARMLWDNVNRLIEQFEIPVDLLSNKHWSLCRFIARLQKEATVAGASMPTAPNLVGEVLDNSAHKAFLENATLGEVIACFRREHGERWRAQRAQRYTHVFRLMVGLLGAATKIRDLTRRDFIEARSTLDTLSPDFIWNPETKHLPVREAAARCVELGMTPRSVVTVNNHMKAFRTLMIYAEAEGFVDRNVTVKLFRTARPDQVTHVLPFSVDQMMQFFTIDPRYQADVPFEERDARFWVPLISLFAGLRIGEAAQLYVPDIETHDGIPVIIVSAADMKSIAIDKILKTPYSARVVPMHPILQEMGLIEFAAMMRRRSEFKLFPEARRGWMIRFDKLVRHRPLAGPHR
jgi:hypothetical protein